MNANAVGTKAVFTFVARRNNSLSSGGRFLVLGSLAVVVLAIALGFAFHGAWLILPFAGLDILVVILAFRYVEQRAGDYECITIFDDRIVIERQFKSQTQVCEFNRHWVQMMLTEAHGTTRGRLVLRSHGREVEFGSNLTGAQRAALAARLKEHLKIR